MGFKKQTRWSRLFHGTVSAYLGLRLIHDVDLVRVPSGDQSLSPLGDSAILPDLISGLELQRGLEAS